MLRLDPVLENHYVLVLFCYLCIKKIVYRDAVFFEQWAMHSVFCKRWDKKQEEEDRTSYVRCDYYQYPHALVRNYGRGGSMHAFIFDVA